MSLLSRKQKQRIIAASLSLACLGAMGTSYAAALAADTRSPLP